MATAERVYRAVAHYDGGHVVRRRFLTKRARDKWAQGRREGYPEEPDTHIDYASGEGNGRPALEPALRVDVADSDPVTWPEGVA